jgi:hypothetical protein
MLTNELLATMVVRSVVFHDVPNQRGDGGTEVVLATESTHIDAPRRRILQDKLKKVLGSRSAYGIVFSAQTTSPVPQAVRTYTARGNHAGAFIGMSQGLARHLHQVQHGAVSPGLLCVIDIAVAGRHGLVLMKLEREEGAQLELSRKGSSTRFEMSVLDNLVLTDGTRLFKTAAFLRTGAGNDEFEMSACDSQRQTTDRVEMARFWISYLGCNVEEEPRVTTAKFFSNSLEFINSYITDPSQKTELYESLHAEMHSHKHDIVPRNFIRDYVPNELQPQFREFLEERHVPLNTFVKDTDTIKSALKRLTFVSAEGVHVVAPEGKEELIRVREEDILVNDRLLRVGRG